MPAEADSNGLRVPSKRIGRLAIQLFWIIKDAMTESRDSEQLIELASTDAIFEVLGGLQTVAVLTGSKYKAVANWKAANAFPAKTFLVITTALRDRGFSAPATLWNMVEAAEAAE